jgi:hypothetical protein
VGKARVYSDATEWQVTRAILSNSMAVSTPEGRLKHNQRVDALMREHGLVHIGWLRLASKANPLSCSDINTQQARSTGYTRQLRDALVDDCSQLLALDTLTTCLFCFYF